LPSSGKPVPRPSPKPARPQSWHGSGTVLVIDDEEGVRIVAAKALEMSSFKCGHDAPIYGVIEGIIEKSGTPYFCFKDLDENKPSGSIRIRVETIDYFLRRYREDIIKRRVSEQMIEEQLAEYERELRAIQGPRPSEDSLVLIST